jgi:photosystem II stability/assembly factor-like uncharacterized protein
MKRRLLLLGLSLACLFAIPFVVSPSAARAVVSPATVWGGQTSGTEEWLESVTFVNATTGWIAGFDGTILHTGNGGQTWTAQTAGTSSDLYRVDFVGPSDGWVVGDEGTILHTTDGGTTWDSQVSGTIWGLYGADFVNEDEGWAAGNGMILHTPDGGQTWAKQTLPSLPPSVSWFFLRSIDLVDSNTGWAVGSDGVILHTDNGGTTWSVQSSGTAEDLEEVFFLDGSNGWAVGVAGTILHTSNGGATWSPQNPGTTSDLASVWFTDADTGWAVGDEGTILRTANGGATWSAQKGGSYQYLRSVAFVTRSSGWAVGLGGTILHAAKPVRLTVSAEPTVVAYGGTVHVTGRLTTAAGSLIAHRSVTLMASSDRVSWRRLKTLSSSTGKYSTSVAIRRRTYLRFEFAGDTTYALGRSATRSVTSRALLGAPAVPSPVYKYRPYTCYGTLKPQHRQGWYDTVVYCYAYGDGRWQFLFSKSAENRDYRGYTRYKFSFELKGTGAWTCRIRAVHKDADHARTVSAWRYFAVR